MRRRNLCISLVSMALITSTPIFGQSIVEVIRLPSTTYWNQGYGLAADTSHLYLSSGTTTVVYNRGFIYTANLSAILTDSIPTGLSSSQGLAWDGTHFWYVRGSGSSLRIYKITTAGAIVDSILPPSTWFLGGACWDGTGLWVSLYFPNNLVGLYKYNVVTKTIVDTIPSLGLQPQGIAWDGQYLYYSMDDNDGDAEKIYQVNPATNDTVRSWPLPENNMSPRGLAWDGHHLWLVAEPVGASSGRSLYKYDLVGSGTPDIDVTALVDFGGTRIGQQRTINTTVSNFGTAPLRIDSVRITLSAQITTTFAGPVTIPPNSSTQLPLTYTPVSFGSDTASVRIYSNDPDESPKFVGARGFGIYGNPWISAPSNYDFGVRRAGSSNTWLVTIQNQGGPQLGISSMTLSHPSYRLDSVAFPVTIDSLARKAFRIWFTPTTTSTVIDTLRFTSNASNGPITSVILQGTGDATPVAVGQPFWTFTVPNNPRTTSNTKLMKAVRAISDITNDGKPDVVVSSENYWTMALNGNASVSNDTLWAFNTYISSFSAGSIGSTGDYSHQKALAVADLNQDDFKDVIIGTGGGNEHVYALNGRNGQILWQFGTDDPDSFSLGDFTGVDVSTDFNNDGVPDVVAAAAAAQSGGVGGRRSMYLFNGTNGNIIWQAPLLGFTHGVAAVRDINGDNVPDAIGTVGEPTYKCLAHSGTNGSPLWEFPLTSGSGGAKEVMTFPRPSQPPDVILGAFWGPVYRLNGTNAGQAWSYFTGGVSGGGVMQLARLRDVTGDGVDEVLVALLGNGAVCLNGASGGVVWSLPTDNTMGIAPIPDLNGDVFDDVVIAVQNQGTMIVKGQDGAQLALYPTGSQQTREVAVVPDMDGNNSFEIIIGGQQGNVALLSGGSGASSVGEVGEVPKGFSISQNYPNPFNPSTTIKVSLPTQSDFSLTIYDVLGRRVKDFVYEHVPAGIHEVTWDGKNAGGSSSASGVYFCNFTSGEKTITQRMLLLK